MAAKPDSKFGIRNIKYHLSSFVTWLDPGNLESDSNLLPPLKWEDNCHIRKKAKYNPSMSHQSCKMTALDFDLECTDLRPIELNVIDNQKQTYPRFKETLAYYPKSIDETLSK